MNKMNKEQQILFFKRMTFLIKAGLSIVESLNNVKEQSPIKNLPIINSLIEDVSSGKKFSASLQKFPKTFNEFTVNIIDFGESSGTLSQNLEYLTEELIKRKGARKKIVNALIYPAIVSISTLFITVFLISYLFPKIVPVFQSMNIKLPITTRVVIQLSEIIKNNGIYILFGLFITISIFAYFLKHNKKFNYITNYSLLKIPIIGKVLKIYNISGFSRTLGLLLQGGMTLSDALPIAQKTTSNIVYKEEINQITFFSNNGENISSYIKTRSNIFPQEVSAILYAGEKSGNLSESLIYLSRNYELEIDDFTKNLSNLIEPIMMVLVGLLVGLIAVSIISPIYSITQNLQK